MDDDLPGWVTAPDLAPAWRLVAARLEATGLVPEGATRVPVPDTAARHALHDLLGRRPSGSGCRIDLAALDRRLADRAGCGLVAAVERVLGRPLVDRPAARAGRDDARAAPIAAARAALAGTHLEHADWVESWLSGLREDGVVLRLRDGAAVLASSVRVLVAVTASRGAGTARSRTEVAAEVLHDAHGLDHGRPTTTLVLRALALRAGRAAPTDAAQRTALWEAVGVLPDLASTTCLTSGVRWDADRGSGAWCEAAASGAPWHVTGWDLRRRALRAAPGQRVLVCENPSVLLALTGDAAERAAVVCTGGRPNLVVLGVLENLAGAGASLRYHGDFDWAGIAIANQVVHQVGAVPWAMGTADYEAAPGELPLVGRPVQAAWDADLAPAMLRRGVAVHEEAVVERLVLGWAAPSR